MNSMYKKEKRFKLIGFLAMLAVYPTLIFLLAFKSCSEAKPAVKIATPLSEIEKQIKEESVSMGETYYIDNHVLVQYRSDSLKHLLSCQQCLKHMR